jgi:V/A-type H+-transporting ATPase subunit C
MSESNSSYPYASARVKAIESKLITKEKLNRLVEAKDYEAAMRQLAEFGYGQSAGAIGSGSFETLIQKELEETDTLLEALSPSDVFTRIMRAERDYFNLKVLIKLLMQDKPLDSFAMNPGNIPVDTLRRAISENNYYDLPATMKEALQYIDRQFTIAADASIIGIALDRAYAKEIEALLPQMGNPLITAYFTALFDISNIIALMRVRAANLPKESFERVFVHGGSIDKRTLSEAFDLPEESLSGAVAKGDYSSVLSAAFEDYAKSGSLYMMEKSRDDYLLSMLREQRHDMFGIGPLMGYYIAKQREAAAVRLVMTAKLGGVDMEVASYRLKELY